MSVNRHDKRQTTYILSQPHSFIDYLLEPLTKGGAYHIRPHRRRRSLKATVLRFLRSILPGKHPGLWSRAILGKEYVDFLKQIQPDDKLIFWAIGNQKDIRIISEDVNTGNISSLIWDPLRQVCHFSDKQIAAYPGLMKRLGVRVSTFDPVDAGKYGLNYVGQVFRYPDSDITPKEDVGEVIFIGVEKRRAEMLERVASQMESEGVSYTMMVVPGKHYSKGKYPRVDKGLMASAIPYERVIEYSMGAKCLLDIVQPGQTGLTMRALEAPMFGKKLITNNPSIVDEPFYHPANIYILGSEHDSGRTIREFLDTPPVEIDKEILDKYDITTWINKL